MSAATTGTWLFDEERYRVYSRLALALYVLAGIALWATSQALLDRAGKPLGSDFITFWSAGQLTLEGRAASAFDAKSIFEAQRIAVPASEIGLSLALSADLPNRRRTPRAAPLCSFLLRLSGAEPRHLLRHGSALDRSPERLDDLGRFPWGLRVRPARPELAVECGLDGGRYPHAGTAPLARWRMYRSVVIQAAARPVVPICAGDCRTVAGVYRSRGDDHGLRGACDAVPWVRPVADLHRKHPLSCVRLWNRAHCTGRKCPARSFSSACSERRRPPPTSSRFWSPSQS